MMSRKIRGGDGAKRRRGAFAFLSFLLATSLLAGCGANEGILKSGKETPSQANAQSGKTPIAEDIEAMRTAGFNFIYVLRRKDGGVIDAEDRGVIKVNTATANRRVSADGDKAFVVGSNPPIAPNNMMALYERFAVENYSPEPAPAANTNANVNK